MLPPPLPSSALLLATQQRKQLLLRTATGRWRWVTLRVSLTWHRAEGDPGRWIHCPQHDCFGGRGGLSALADISQSHRRTNLEMHFWFWVCVLLTLGLHQQLGQSSVRICSVKPTSEDLVPAKVPEIALGPPLTAMLAIWAHKAELLL